MIATAALEAFEDDVFGRWGPLSHGLDNLTPTLVIAPERGDQWNLSGVNTQLVNLISCVQVRAVAADVNPTGLPSDHCWKDEAGLACVRNAAEQMHAVWGQHVFERHVSTVAGGKCGGQE